MKCKSCGKNIYFDVTNKGLINNAVYCEHCNKVVFYTELPFSIVTSIVKWILFTVVFIIYMNIWNIFMYLMIWSLLEKIFIKFSYKYLYKN